MKEFQAIYILVLVFEPTGANSRWALMRRFPSVRLSVCRYTNDFSLEKNSYLENHLTYGYIIQYDYVPK